MREKTKGLYFIPNVAQEEKEGISWGRRGT